LQLFTLGDAVGRDLDGTLAAVAAIGFRTVETAGLAGRTAPQFRAALDRAGLGAPAMHVGWDALTGDLAGVARDAGTLGAAHVVLPTFPAPDGTPGPAEGQGWAEWISAVATGMSRDDWRRLADRMNRIGRDLAPSGVRLAYHNHDPEFRPLGDGTALDALMDATDPAVVDFELDVGWAVTAGLDPAALIAARPDRIRLLHLKDVRPARPPGFDLRLDSVAVGTGVVDWPGLLEAARAAGITRMFLEQEQFDRPRLEAVEAGFDFLARRTG
ncbi:MAG: sugar phosphate isomerase/epimerase, partial [Alphaproteobacteria bacterium]|nr:sugar phosphate isomerase/epimerase [Alphaproteobacteria bacterium]